MQQEVNELYQSALHLTDGQRRILAGLIEMSVDMPIGKRYDVLKSIAEKTWNTKLEPSRKRKDTIIRIFVAYRMREEGYRFREIADAMGRTHASVIHLINRMNDMLALPKAYMTENEKYQEFIELIDKYDEESKENGGEDEQE